MNKPIGKRKCFQSAWCLLNAKENNKLMFICLMSQKTPLTYCFSARLVSFFMLQRYCKAQVKKNLFNLDNQ